MLKTVRWFAIIALVSVILLDGALLLGVFSLPAQYPGASTTAAFNIAQPTIALFCILTGLLALAPAVERRQLGWFAAILVSLVVGGYGPLGVNALWSVLVAANYQPGTNPSSSSSFLLANGAIVSALSVSIPPAIPVAIALLYTLRAGPSPAGPPPAAAPPSNTTPQAPASPQHS